MKLSDFDYTLPKELIAQHPSERRGEDRLLVLDRKRKSFEGRSFGEIPDFFKEGDLLVLNDTRVIPARLFGKRKTGGKVEIFVLDKAKNPAPALVRPSGRIKEGEKITLASGEEAEILGSFGIGRKVLFQKTAGEVLKECGHVPLPPYISRPDEASDRERYQTVYASSEGATASPTAGLHFTKAMIEALKEKGVGVAYVTLHVSYGTFAPVKEETVEKHKMHSEPYCISEENSAIITRAIKEKRRIFACGTTSLRALEACSGKFGKVPSQEGVTDLFIYPGYKFRVVKALITNFHLPKSTLLLLASAFAGKELLFKAYEHAKARRFRFFSYGDATLII